VRTAHRWQKKSGTDLSLFRRVGRLEHMAVLAAPSTPRDPLAEINRRFYDGLWSGARLIEAPCFNTWPLLQGLSQQAPRRLEVGPGLRARLPIAGTHFVEISRSALGVLRRHTASTTCACITALPFGAAAFDLVCALDIIEHVADDQRALAELVRVTAPNGIVVLSLPLHPARWTRFDAYVGHHRRYEPATLPAALARHGLRVERSAGFGMQPRSSRWLDFGMYFLERQRARAMWWYNRVIMPIALRTQGVLALHDGLLPAADVDEVLLVCRRSA
jgi:SAM-dependent methyltransferase